ncbi:MAG: LysM peptidoglycan-binding domain-containing protein [Chloroflexi bacterium]|nr:LysM peptidoglycan-binding domain-containing protein [Chloroflexota bacterium]
MTDARLTADAGPGLIAEGSNDADAALLPAGVCPFLIAAGGAYRMGTPDREHRCAAFAPATSLALAKQARLCLTRNHPGCATYVASISARQARVGAAGRVGRAGRWGIARTMPVVEEVGGLRATLGALIADRRTWPAIPAVLLATLLLALGLSGSWGQTPITAVASPTPTPRLTPRATPSVVPSAVASVAPASEAPSATPAPTAVATPAATATVAYTTYKVTSGDTLSGIASRFHTTVSAIMKLNGLTTTNLRVGQILKIPKA